MTISTGMQIPARGRYGRAPGELRTNENAGMSPYVPGSKGIEKLDTSSFNLAKQAASISAEGGQDIANAIKGLGPQFKKISDTAYEIWKKSDDIEIAKAQDMVARLTELGLEERQKQGERRSGNAIGANDSGEDVITSITKSNERLEGMFRKDIDKLGANARRVFNLRSREFFNQQDVWARTHQDKETTEYFKDVMNGSAYTAGSLIAANNGEAQVVAEQLGIVDARIDAYAGRMGLPPEVRQQLKDKARHDAAERTVKGSIAQQDYDGATKALNNLKAAGLTDDDFKIFEKSIYDAKISWARSAAASGYGSPAEQILSEATGAIGARFPKASKEVKDLVSRVAGEEGVNSVIFHAIIAAESGYDPAARSKTGAYGLGQITSWARKQVGGGLDPKDPEQNLRIAARYFKYCYDQAGHDLNKALEMYNGGPGAVRQWYKTGKWPSGDGKRPVENEKYASRVRSFIPKNIRLEDVAVLSYAVKHAWKVRSEEWVEQEAARDPNHYAGMSTQDIVRETGKSPEDAQKLKEKASRIVESDRAAAYHNVSDTVYRLLDEGKPDEAKRVIRENAERIGWDRATTLSDNIDRKQDGTLSKKQDETFRELILDMDNNKITPQEAEQIARERYASMGLNIHQRDYIINHSQGKIRPVNNLIHGVMKARDDILKKISMYPPEQKAALTERINRDVDAFINKITSYDAKQLGELAAILSDDAKKNTAPEVVEAANILNKYSGDVSMAKQLSEVSAEIRDRRDRMSRVELEAGTTAWASYFKAQEEYTRAMSEGKTPPTKPVPPASRVGRDEARSILYGGSNLGWGSKLLDKAPRAEDYDEEGYASGRGKGGPPSSARDFYNQNTQR